MKTKLDFKEKVQAMSAKEIIMAMVEGLKNPYTKIDMSSWGASNDKGICYGCAATNAICHINNGDKTHLIKNDRFLVSNDKDFMSGFEDAIDSLRKGRLISYNRLALRYGFASISSDMYLPRLEDDYTLEQLEAYELLANSQ